MGKIFHRGQGDDNSWSEPMPQVWRYGTAESMNLMKQLMKQNEGAESEKDLPSLEFSRQLNYIHLFHKYASDVAHNSMCSRTALARGQLSTIITLALRSIFPVQSRVAGFLGFRHLLFFPPPLFFC